MTIRRGDILWADLGMFPTTSVQGGVRPVIVVSNNKANTYSSVITVVPLTSRIYKKRYLPTHVFISKYDMTGIRKGSLALAEQVMSISTKCIIEKCGRVNKWSLESGTESSTDSDGNGRRRVTCHMDIKSVMLIKVR